jgi:hypothetical protein
MVVAAVACSDAGSPATAPPTTEATTTSTTTAPPSTAPPTTAAPTTTLDRVAEIEAVFERLALARLLALFENDETAYRALFSVDSYLQQSMEVFGAVEFVQRPTQENFSEEVLEVLVDSDDCIAAMVRSDRSEILKGAGSSEAVTVLTRRSDGRFGYAYAGTGWLCDGPHPLDA